MDALSYIAIDLKSFYASVECVSRGLDHLKTNLVVADASRTEKTICLAVSPGLKKLGISGRPRLFEVIQKIGEINALRRGKAPGRSFSGKSADCTELEKDPSLELDYIVAPPRMAAYMETSARIYQIYLKYFAPEDIHVYSIDEVFIDATPYLKLYRMSTQELARKVILEVLAATGITATAGIGSNLYLCKVAMDIVAKHLPADRNGVRIAALDEMTYRKTLWSHRPITDFWRVGHGYARKLEKAGLFTMGDIARCSLGKPTDFHNENLLYKLFGIQAELLIDHAWGWEPCTMQDIKQYRPSSNSMGTGQVLPCPYTAEKAALVTREMTDRLVLDLAAKGMGTDQITLTVGYDISNLSDPARIPDCQGITVDHYGRSIPRHAHGSTHLGQHTASQQTILTAVKRLYQRIVDPRLLVRRITITANNILPEHVRRECENLQLNFFADPDAELRQQQDRQRQAAILSIQERYGKNALLKGMNLEAGATIRTRNNQIGGHRA